MVHRSTIWLTLTVCILAMGISPLKAATTKSDALVADIRLDAEFLVRASDAAARNSGSESVKRFAAAQRIEQLNVLHSLPSGAIGELAELEPGTMTTGRSVAKNPDVDDAASQKTAASLPAAIAALDHLASAKGKTFDVLYVSAARSVLNSLVEACDAYSKTDNPARNVAAFELPLARTALDTLQKLSPSKQQD